MIVDIFIVNHFVTNFTIIYSALYYLVSQKSIKRKPILQLEENKFFKS